MKLNESLQDSWSFEYLDNNEENDTKKIFDFALFALELCCRLWATGGSKLIQFTASDRLLSLIHI